MDHQEMLQSLQRLNAPTPPETIRIQITHKTNGDIEGDVMANFSRLTALDAIRILAAIRQRMREYEASLLDQICQGDQATIDHFQAAITAVVEKTPPTKMSGGGLCKRV